MNGRLPRLTPVLSLLAATAVAACGVASLDLRAADQAGTAAGPPALPAASPPASESDEPTAGDRLVMQAIAQLERRGSVQASLRHQIAIETKQLTGTGSYLQQGSGDGLRVRLELKIEGQEARLLQVSNTRHLWVDRQVPTGRDITRIDLGRLKSDPTLGLALIGAQPIGATWAASGAAAELPAAGLPNLLAALRENFTFLPPQPMRLALAPPAAAQPASIPVYAVVGHWKAHNLVALLSNGKDKILKGVPGRIPLEVLLLVGQADLCPYRIEYRKLETRAATDENGAIIPYQLSANPMIVLELADVAFDVPIARGEFDYAPGDAKWTDQTAAVAEQLRRDQELAGTTAAGEQPLVGGRDQPRIRN